MESAPAQELQVDFGQGVWVIDNLKAGVLQADWYDPELNPKLEEFARHYGTVILQTKPVMPRHKYKVESAVKYAQNNAVKAAPSRA